MISEDAIQRQLGNSLERTDFAGLGKKYEGKVSFAKINVEDNPRISSQVKVFSIPNLILFKGGKVFAQLVGRTSRKDIESLILSGLEVRPGHS